MEFLYTRRFLRSLKKLPRDVQEDILSAVDRFGTDKNNPTLRLHKLTGRMKKYHAFSANYIHRVIVEIRKEVVYFIDTGDHDIYQ